MRRSLKAFASKLTETVYSMSLRLPSRRGVSLEHLDPPLVVSMTTIPKRVDHTAAAVASILSQSLKPTRVALFVGFDPKPHGWLNHAKKKGVEVHIVEDIGPHTKLIPAMELWPDAVVVTADDDIIYPSGWLRGLYESYLKRPTDIHCYSAQRLRYLEDGTPVPTSMWEPLIGPVSGMSRDMLALGCHGILYPPRCLPSIAFDRGLIKQLAPYADDLWFNVMSQLRNSRVTLLSKLKNRFRTIESSQKLRLGTINNNGGENQRQNLRLHSYFAQSLKFGPDHSS